MVALEAGDRAPHAGMLVLDDDLYALQRDLRLCGAELSSSGTLAERIADARVAQEQARTRAAEASAALHERLWRDRAEQLARELTEAHGAVDAWWRSPVLWAGIGAALVAIVAVALAVAVGG